MICNKRKVRDWAAAPNMPNATICGLTGLGA